MDDWSDIIKLNLEALDVNPECVDVYVSLARMYGLQNKWSDAHQIAKKGIEIGQSKCRAATNDFKNLMEIYDEATARLYALDSVDDISIDEIQAVDNMRDAICCMKKVCQKYRDSNEECHQYLSALIFKVESLHEKDCERHYEEQTKKAAEMWRKDVLDAIDTKLVDIRADIDAIKNNNKYWHSFIMSERKNAMEKKSESITKDA